MVAAKRMSKNKKKPVKRASKAVVKAPQQVDKAVRDYIALLKDPCNGPLIGPVGATANGYITRFETTITVNPSQNFFALRWVPGGINFAAGDNGLYIVESGTDTGALVSVATNPNSPGYSFLNGTCQTFRCLAACAQIRYTDTEVNRSGVLGSTICTGARTFANVREAFSVTVDRARVPDQALEVLWQPGDGDELFTPQGTGTLDLETLSRKNGILIAGTSCRPASISVRLVVVFQWTPQSNDSIILPVPRPGTGITMARVVQLAQQAGFMAGHLIKGYATGGLYGVAREAASMIRPSLRSMR